VIEAGAYRKVQSATRLARSLDLVATRAPSEMKAPRRPGNRQHWAHRGPAGFPL